MSIFGNFASSSKTAPSGSGGLLGAAPPAGSSLFGPTTSPNPQQSTGLFGNATNTGGSTTNATSNTPAPGASSLFGPTSQNPLFSGASTSTGGNNIFGNTPATNPLGSNDTGGGLLGSSTTNQGGSKGGLFGPTNGTTGGIFGSTSNSQQPANTTTNTTTPAQGGSSLFGSTSQNPLFGGTGTSTNTTSTGGSSIFGTPATNTGNTGGGIFGSNTTSTGTSIFGPTNQGGSTGGLFGDNKTGTAAGAFGSTTNTQQLATTATTNPFANTAGSSIFGSKPAGTGLFGSTAANPLFGGGQQQQQQQQQSQPSSLFGSTATNPLFGSTNRSSPSQPGLTTSTLTAPSSFLPAGVSQQQPADAQAQFQKLLQSIEAIYSAWNPQSRDCRFQYPFYNLVDPKQVGFYMRPPHVTNDAVWERAVKENPDPSCLVPVIAIGFDDLRVRVDAQSTQSTAHLQRLKDIQSRLDALRTQHSVSNSSRILRATALQIQLSQKVLHLVQHLHLLIPSVRSSALGSEEEALRGKLEEIDDELRRGRVKGRLNELWALIGAIGAGTERAGTGPEGGDWQVVDEEGLAQIVQILGEQQAGLQHLTKILQKDLKDLGVVMGTKGSGSSYEMDVEAAGENVLWSSTSTLRASSLG